MLKKFWTKMKEKLLWLRARSACYFSFLNHFFTFSLFFFFFFFHDVPDDVLYDAVLEINSRRLYLHWMKVNLRFLNHLNRRYYWEQNYWPCALFQINNHKIYYFYRNHFVVELFELFCRKLMCSCFIWKCCVILISFCVKELF